MSKWYPHLMKHVQITMVECMDHILNCFDAKISEYAGNEFSILATNMEQKRHLSEPTLMFV